VGFLLEVVNISTYMGGVMIWKKILEKNLVDMWNVFYLWWVGGFVYIRTNVVFIGMKKSS
jgi:hypothetical protein